MTYRKPFDDRARVKELPRVAALIPPPASSDTFGILFYDSTAPSWAAAARLVAGEAIAASSRLFVTAADGLTRTEMSSEEFCSRFEERTVTISADWWLDGFLDGYVVATFARENNVATECYDYGALDQFETTFLSLLFARFVALVQGGHHSLLAIEGEGLSGVDDWHAVYDGLRDFPETATFVAMPMGAYRGKCQKLTRDFEDYGIEVFAPAK